MSGKTYYPPKANAAIIGTHTRSVHNRVMTGSDFYVFYTEPTRWRPPTTLRVRFVTRKIAWKRQFVLHILPYDICTKCVGQHVLVGFTDGVRAVLAPSVTAECGRFAHKSNRTSWTFTTVKIRRERICGGQINTNDFVFCLFFFLYQKIF